MEFYLNLIDDTPKQIEKICNNENEARSDF